jgi:NAD+ synthetase
MSEIRKGNIMARVRMIVAYDQSEAFKGLVIGTGNKTEILLGYTTLYGDAACAINPIGDLYKTQVRQLAHALSIPEPIIAKPPSADLWTGQTDEGELGFTYTDVDRLLYLLTSATAPKNAWKPGLKKNSSIKFSNASARTNSSAYCRLLPSSAAARLDTIFYISVTGAHDQDFHP